MNRTSPTLAFVVFATVLGLTSAARTQDLFVALPLEAESPADNPSTPAKVELGRLLFWDPILSGRKDVACATCHHPEFGYTDGLDVAMGTHGVGFGAGRRFDNAARPFVKRNSPTILNAAFNGMDTAGGYNPAAAPMFWDMRATSLEGQALEPLKAFDEMRGDTFVEPEAVDMVVARLQAIPEYRERFARAFNVPAGVTATNLARAIAAFERSLVAPNAPFDRYMRGDAAAMTPLQVLGMQRFQSAGCINCHSGPMFSDYKTHTIGVADNARHADPDPGVDGRFRFRTPSLRNLTYTAPYMHSGVIGSLEEVLSFYNGVRGFRLGTQNPNVQPRDLDPFVFQLNLGGDRRSLVAFLEALSDDSFDKTIPTRVPSGLPPGGRIN